MLFDNYFQLKVIAFALVWCEPGSHQNATVFFWHLPVTIGLGASYGQCFG
jgi:hypothetical protein